MKPQILRILLSFGFLILFVLFIIFVSSFSVYVIEQGCFDRNITYVDWHFELDKIYRVEKISRDNWNCCKDIITINEFGAYEKIEECKAMKKTNGVDKK